MTEQLMDNLSNEEHERLLLMSEHAIAPPLSAAAQAVYDAAVASFWKSTFTSEAIGAAGALRAAAGAANILRAAAQQVDPSKYIPDIDYVHQSYVNGFQDAIAIMLELADELDPQ